MADDDGDKPLELPITHNRPTSSRQRPGQNITASTNSQPSSEWHKPRDPRFDPRCAGSNDLRHFVRNYSFVDDFRRKELKELERAKRTEKDPQKKVKIQQTINRTRNKMVERENKSKKLDLIGEMKSSRKDDKEESGDVDHGSDRVGGRGTGKFRNLKKSDIKKSLIVNKYKELKESGKLKKYLERKRKKLINRDGKAFAQL